MRTSIRRMLAALLLGGPPSGRTEEGDEFFQFMAEEGKIVTVASANRPESLVNSVSNVTVIDRETIEAQNFASVADALQTVPGVAVWRTYIMQHVPTMRGGLQDHYANKVLVMIDGVPAYHAVTAEGDLDRVGIDAVERIEVLRGPASVIYGTNALNGAINIVLRKAPKEGHGGMARAGIGTGHERFRGSTEVKRAGGYYARREDRDTSYLIAADMSNEASPLYRFSDDARAVTYFQDYLSARSFNFRGQHNGHSLLVNAAASE